MFIKRCITKRGAKTYHHYQIVKSYREDGKTRHQVLANLGVLSQKTIDTLIRGLNRIKEKPYSLIETGLKSKKVLAYGDVQVLVALWDRLGISKIINRHLRKKCKASFDVAAYALLMTIHRLINPGSKLALTDWFMKIDFPQISDLDYLKLLRSLAYVYRVKDEVEADLFQAQQNLFNLKVDIIFYDVTSTYFEGEGPEYAAKGYSRDRRPDRVQILLALAVTQEGLPIGHESYAGNISDKSTVIELIEKLKTRFSISRCIFVGDRGMVSPENIAYLKRQNYEYIFALRRRRLRESEDKFETNLEKYKSFKTYSFDGNIKEVKYFEYAADERGRRYLVCHNEEMAIKDQLKVEERIKKISQRIEEIRQEYKNPQIILRYVSRITLVDRFFKYGIAGGKFFFYLKEESVEFEKLIAGKYVLKTDTKDLSAEKIIETYKNLLIVENAFKDMKNFIDLRPIYHREDIHVKGHIFICVLSYLLQRVLEKYFYQADEPKITARRILAMLADIKVVENELNGHLIGTITESTKETQTILKKLNLQSFGQHTLLYKKTVKLPAVTLTKLRRYNICSK
ncbi:IS1634 family transposase [Patescibacteria group bacterium]|nr:IS1634 family transposase [Patescibacteria group bacterium]